MQLIKPVWVSHNGYPLYCCDIHPDGRRFATGGGDNKVRVWSLKPVTDENDTETPKSLSVLESHYGTVNSVRWSPIGRHLASCADDKMIFIWELVNTVPTTLFGSNETIYEQYRIVGTLRGHVLDVTDLCWSPDGTKIASASLDNKVIIWDAVQHLQLKVLSEHTNWVKGVAWDPIGRYLATQSEDRSVILWRTMDWGMESKVDKPFQKVTDSTFSMRLSWSPDGSYVTITQGMNNKQPTAIVLKRGEWSTFCDFVGHKQAITVTKFNPRIFRRGANQEPHFICAVGSQDCCISIWSTAFSRPLLVARDLFNQSVLDLSWSRDGYTLLACSSDGTLVALQFATRDFGEPVPEREVNAMIKKHYGEILNVPTTLQLAESPLILDLEKKSQTQNETASIVPKKIVSTPIATGVVATPVVAKGPIKQTEMKLPDGRKRVVPQLVVSPTQSMELTSKAPVLTTPSSSFVGSISSVPSTPPPTRTVNIVPTTPSVPPTQPMATTPMETNSKEKRKPTTEDESTNKKPKTTEDEKGKEEKEKSKEDKEKKDEQKKDKDKEKEKEKEKPRDKEKEREKDKEKDKDKDKDKKDKNKSKSERRRERDANRVPPPPRIQAPNPLPKIIVQISSQNKSQPALSIEANITEVPGSGDYVTLVTCFQSDRALWEDRIKARVLNVAANSKFISCGCEDGSLYIFSHTGRMLFPCISLGETIAALECNKGDHLLAITCAGSIFVWDIIKQKANLNTSLVHLLNNEKEITFKRARLTEEGLPLVTLSNYYSFVYHYDMKSFMRVADDKFLNSEYTSLHAWQAESMGPLSELQSLSSQNMRASPMIAFNASAQQKAMETIGHLENQVLSSVLVGSGKEYKYWLELYVRRLTNDANESKLHEVCSQLLGPPHKVNSDALKKSNWEPSILGFPKRELLNDLLPIVSSNRALQRIVTQYREGLANVM